MITVQPARDEQCAQRLKLQFEWDGIGMVAVSVTKDGKKEFGHVTITPEELYGVVLYFTQADRGIERNAKAMEDDE